MASCEHCNEDHPTPEDIASLIADAMMGPKPQKTYGDMSPEERVAARAESAANSARRLERIGLSVETVPEGLRAAMAEGVDLPEQLERMLDNSVALVAILARSHDLRTGDAAKASGKASTPSTQISLMTMLLGMVAKNMYDKATGVLHPLDDEEFGLCAQLVAGVFQYAFGRFPGRDLLGEVVEATLEVTGRTIELFDTEAEFRAKVGPRDPSVN